MKFRSLTSLILVLAVVATASATVADFENLTLADDSHWSGTYPSSGLTTTFNSGDAAFTNHSSSNGGYYNSWDSWAYSNETDSTTAGYTNQFSAYVTDGDGHAYTAGDNQYGVYYQPWSNAPTVSFTEATISGMWVTNTTYAYLTILNGEGPATAFSAGDWFKLTVTGSNNNTVDFYLADFTSANNNEHYIVDQWTWVNLSGLGNVTSLEFSFTSTDNDPEFGMNTPAYLAMDNFNGSASQAPVPEPVTIALLGLGGLFIRRKRA